MNHWCVTYAIFLKQSHVHHPVWTCYFALMPSNWQEAQSYCNEAFTDLVTSGCLEDTQRVHYTDCSVRKGREREIILLIYTLTVTQYSRIKKKSFSLLSVSCCITSTWLMEQQQNSCCAKGLQLCVRTSRAYNILF